MARSGIGPSCAVEPGTPAGGFAPAGAGTRAGWTKTGLGKPGIPVHFRGSVGRDRRERYRQRGRTVARP